MNAAAVRFEDGATVPLDEALDHMDESGSWPKRVVWEDGTWSYAKGWRWSDTGRAVRIGAGAYGTLTVAQR